MRGASGRDLFAPKMGMTLPLCALHFIFFFLYTADPAQTIGTFAFVPGAAFQHPWTFLTYQLIETSPMSLFFGTLVLYIFGSALETEWGTGEFAVFWLVATLGGSVAALALGQTIAGPAIVDVSLLFAYAYLFPETVFYIFFVLPVKVKWLAYLSAGLLLWRFGTGVFQGRALAALVDVVGGSAGFVYFYVRHQAIGKARRVSRDVTTAIKSAGAVREDQSLAKRNRELFPRVEELRRSRREGSAAPSSPLEAELARLVVPGVKICKPVDFKGDKDGICVKCEGFAECSLRYLGGQPEEIVLKPKE